MSFRSIKCAKWACSATSSTIQANGGADTLHFTDALQQSVVKAGADADFFSAAEQLSSAAVSGNKGGDTLTISGVTTQSTLYGGSAASTTDGSDSIHFSSNSVTASSVYGNAGNDTLNFAAAK